MKVIGIVCEYNPFHNGHKYQIEKIKEKYKDSIIVLCMSSSFTQRGEISVINKFDKTKIALNNGADLVVELPYIYTVESSDIFARYALEILNYLKIDELCFGCESDNIDDLINNANIQLYNETYDVKVKKYMNEGYNYPTSLNKALIDLGGKNIDKPNDTLALSYIREIIKNKYNIELFNIKRNNDYNDIISDSDIVSASNIRNKIKNNIDIQKYVPNDVYEVLKNKKDSDDFKYLKYRIISDKNLSDYLDVEEGIDNRIKKYISLSNDKNELIENIKTKRYTYSKINRILNHILCGIKKDDFVDTLEYIRVLGFSKKGKEYLSSIKKNISIPILNSYDKNYKALLIEYKISEIYSLIYEDIMKDEVSLKPIKNYED